MYWRRVVIDDAICSRDAAATGQSFAIGVVASSKMTNNN